MGGRQSHFTRPDTSRGGRSPPPSAQGAALGGGLRWGPGVVVRFPAVASSPPARERAVARVLKWRVVSWVAATRIRVAGFARPFRAPKCAPAEAGAVGRRGQFGTGSPRRAEPRVSACRPVTRGALENDSRQRPAAETVVTQVHMDCRSPRFDSAAHGRQGVLTEGRVRGPPARLPRCTRHRPVTGGPALSRQPVGARRHHTSAWSTSDSGGLQPRTNWSSEVCAIGNIAAWITLSNGIPRISAASCSKN